jgi:thioredoxin-dependent peroxiredoxin
MAPRKKENVEPTRRSTRTVSQSSTAIAIDPPPTAKKRETEDHGNDNPAPESKKAKNGLGVGDKLPDITLHDEEGNPVKINEITFEKGIILFAYPRASTPGCTKQVSISLHPSYPN